MDKPTRILIVEDIAADADLATRALRKILKDCEVRVVETRKDFLKALEVFQPDVILSDYSLPHFDGMKALNLALEHAPLTPLIIWTGSVSEDVAVACMKAGANNYVLKENSRRLGPAVIHALEERELLMARKQAEARINDLLAFNEKILNNSPLGILTYKFTGECVYANENAAAIVGARVDELQAQNFHTLDAWKKSGLYDLVQKAITTQTPVTGDIHHISTFGKDLWLTVHCVTFQSKGEDHVLLSLSDITERKRAEEALREGENRLILALSGAQMSVWEWNLQTNQILWSPEIFEITGIAGNQLGSTFESFTHLIHADDIAHVMAAAQKAMTERTLFAEEFRIVRPDGAVRWLANLGHTEYDTTRDHLRLIGTVQDITQRKQAEIERQALLEIMQGFANTKDLQELLKLIHHSIAKVIHAENFFVVLYRPNSGLFEEIYSVDQYDPAVLPSKLEKSITSYVFRSGEPLLLTQARFEELARQDEVRLIGTNSASWLGVPLETLGGTIGVMAVQDYESDNRYSEHDKDFMGSIATQVASAIERKQAEELLRQSEERFSSAFEYAAIGMALVTPTGQWLRVNRALCSLIGYSMAELLRKTFQDITHPDDLEGDLNYVHQLLMGEINSYQMEKRYFHKLGHVVWVLLSVSLVRDDAGKPLYFISQIQDITERKRVEDALRLENERFLRFVESNIVGIVIANATGNIILANDYYLNILGVNRQDFLEGKVDWRKFTPPEWLPADEKAIRELREHRICEPYEKEYQRADGSRVPVYIADAMLPGVDEQIAAFVLDITERKQAEEALRDSEERHRSLFENMLSGYAHCQMLFDENEKPVDFIYINVNDAFEKATGLKGVDGQKVSEVIPGIQGLNPELFEIYGRVAVTGKPERFETQIASLGIWFSISVYSPKQGYFVAVFDNITERKQSETEVRRHLVELKALHENGLAVGRLLKPGEIGNRVIETFARYLPWHHVTIRLRRGNTDELELVAFSLPNLKEDERAAAEGHFVAHINKVGQGLSGWAIQTGTPLRTGNVHAHPQYISTHAGIQSGLYLPLKIGEQVIGVISVESEAPDAFTEQDERLLATLANQAAIAFENARLYEAVQQELSERKRVEAALRASETHYRQLADSITDILFETDQDLRYTHWNKASEIFSGIPAEYAIGKSMGELFGTSEEQSRREEIYKSILEEQQAKTFETQLVVKGQKRALEINAYPSVRGVSVVAKDVTERKRAETIMQKRFELMEYSASHTLNELMQRTVDEVSELTGSSIGFFHFVEADQAALRIQTWSTNALRLFELPIEEGALLPLDQAGVWAEAARLRHPLIQNDYGSSSKKKDLPQGHAPILRAIAIPVVRNERIIAMMGIGNKLQEYTQYDLEIAERLTDYAWDIIERKQMAVALETERNQLAQRVEERTADLSLANASLERALRVKDEFLANMSHELRTPLNAILGLSESLGEQIAGPLNEKQQKYITTISESGHHLLSLINDILDLAKIEAGQITLDINKVDIYSVCQASLRMVKQLAQKKNQEVSLKIDPGLGLMWADERRLKQMIVNLLGNAVKFTPENGQLGLEVHGDQDANKIMVTVWDHGIGIKEDDLARLFQPFVQLDSGLAREATGTGLGLALVAQMARLHGGSISVVSKPEKGSRFTVVLPWEPALTVETSTRLRNTGKLRLMKSDQTRKPAILLVEDSQDVTMMIQDYLELAGYKVVTAQDGVEALAQARLLQPDLILMDIQLPGMDGLEATRKLRCEPDFRYTPIIALTALAMPDDRERCLAAGMDEYISKPITLKSLLKVIQSFLFNHEESQPG